MQQLSSQGWQRITDLAQRFGVSTDAVLTLLEALVNGHGTMAQFNSWELGGGGQWMQGGMTMVGDMFNSALKAKVDGLCSELAALLASQPFSSPAPSSSQSQSQGDKQQAQGSGYFSGGQASSFSYGTDPSGPPVGLFVPPASGSSGDWWPAGFGAPNAVGSQNNIRYAYFANARRLAVEVNGTLGLYDTLDHQIGGFSQQQGSGGSITFNSQYGVVNLTNLPVISITPVGGSAPEAPPSEAPMPSSQPSYHPSSSAVQEHDIFAKIERLAELKQKNIISDDEFSSKKAELLSRL